MMDFMSIMPKLTIRQLFGKKMNLQEIFCTHKHHVSEGFYLYLVEKQRWDEAVDHKMDL